MVYGDALSRFLVGFYVVFSVGSMSLICLVVHVVVAFVRVMMKSKNERIRALHCVFSLFLSYKYSNQN